MYLKKPTGDFVKKTPFLLIMLLIDFVILISQKIVKNACFLCKHTIKKPRIVTKTKLFLKITPPMFFYHNTT